MVEVVMVEGGGGGGGDGGGGGGRGTEDKEGNILSTEELCTEREESSLRHK